MKTATWPLLFALMAATPACDNTNQRTHVSEFDSLRMKALGLVSKHQKDVRNMLSRMDAAVAKGTTAMGPSAAATRVAAHRDAILKVQARLDALVPQLHNAVRANDKPEVLRLIGMLETEVEPEIAKTDKELGESIKLVDLGGVEAVDAGSVAMIVDAAAMIAADAGAMSADAGMANADAAAVDAASGDAVAMGDAGAMSTDGAMMSADAAMTDGGVALTYEHVLPTQFDLHGAENGVESRLIVFIEDKALTADKATWFDFDRLTFAQGASTLDLDRSRDQLRNLVEILKAYPTVKLKIGAYTDNTGPAATNQQLSTARANEVVKQLVALGADRARLAAEGYGPQFPVCPANDTAECRAKNRRTAVRVMQK